VELMLSRPELRDDPQLDADVHGLASRLAFAMRQEGGEGLLDGFSDSDFEALRWEWRDFWCRPGQAIPGEPRLVDYVWHVIAERAKAQALQVSP